MQRLCEASLSSSPLECPCVRTSCVPCWNRACRPRSTDPFFYMYNDDPLRQPGPHTRSYTPKRWQKPHTCARTHSRVTKVTHTHSYTRGPAEPGGSAYGGVGAVGCSRSGVARGQRALLEADDAVGDVHSVGVDGLAHIERRSPDWAARSAMCWRRAGGGPVSTLRMTVTPGWAFSP